MVSKQTIRKMEISWRPKMWKLQSKNPPWKSAEKQSSRCKDVSTANVSFSEDTLNPIYLCEEQHPQKKTHTTDDQDQ